jgi:hypothetical protein
MAMDDSDATVEPVPLGGGKGEPDIDKLSNIIKTFNDLFGNIEWKDEDKIRKVITKKLQRAWPKTRPIRMRRRIPISKTPSCSTTKTEGTTVGQCARLYPSVLWTQPKSLLSIDGPGAGQTDLSVFRYPYRSRPRLLKGNCIHVRRTKTCPVARYLLVFPALT